MFGWLHSYLPHKVDSNLKIIIDEYLEKGLRDFKDNLAAKWIRRNRNEFPPGSDALDAITAYAKAKSKTKVMSDEQRDMIIKFYDDVRKRGDFNLSIDDYLKHFEKEVGGLIE